jgi:hypothetical protein
MYAIRSAHWRLGFGALPLLLMAGCATYQEPAAGPTATLSVDDRVQSLAVGYAGQCGSMNTVPIDSMGGFKVEAGKTVFLYSESARTSFAVAACVGPMSFDAVPNAQYRLSLSHHLGGCSARLSVQRPGQAWAQDASFKILERRRCMPWE